MSSHLNSSLKFQKKKEGQNNQHSISPTVRIFLFTIWCQNMGQTELREKKKIFVNKTGGTVQVCAENQGCASFGTRRFAKTSTRHVASLSDPREQEETSECGRHRLQRHVWLGGWGWGGVQSGVSPLGCDGSDVGTSG